MARAGSKRSKQSAEESPSTTSASKKRRTERKKVVPEKIAEKKKKKEDDPFLKSFCEKFKHPEDSIQFLLQNSKTSVDDFFKNHWETKPIVLEAPKESKDLDKVFSFDFLTSIIEAAEESQDLDEERDYILSKVVDGEREEAASEPLTKSRLVDCYKTDKFAVQFNQPQRFQECLWAFIEKLECFLGSLVSSQVVFLPEKTQSQLPRYEDTEKFVLQVSGSSAWKLHKFKGEPGEEFKDAIKEAEIGEEILAATLKAGDVLYIPKGTVFESEGVVAGGHIYFSTFNGVDKANLLIQTIMTVIEDESTLHGELLRGLPFGYLPHATSISNAGYADILQTLAESVRSRSTPPPVPQRMIQDFMSHRLPPFGPKFEIESGASIKPESKISLRNKHHIAWFIRKDSGVDMNEDDADEEDAEEDLGPQTELMVLSSLNNDRSRHMMIESRLLDIDGDAFTIGVEYKELLDTLYKAEEPVTIESLKSASESSSDVDPTLLARGLYNIGAIDVSE